MAFGLAVLTGIGTDVLVRSHRERSVRLWTAGGFGGAAVVVGLLRLVGRGRLHPLQTSIPARRASSGRRCRSSSDWP